MKQNTSEAELLQLCLDFANTMDWHASAHPSETLLVYADLVAWAQRTHLISDLVAQRLLQRAENEPASAAAALAQAIVWREAIYRIFSAIAAERPVATADLAALNAAISVAYPHLQLVSSGAEFVWGWIGAEDDLACMLWPLVRSAAELLTSPLLARVRECADERGCGFLFFDLTRNRSRRWCSMESCGNRAKARRHYNRQRGTAEP
jgi:predicted RNA-binding Zn ribbon-like protein